MVNRKNKGVKTPPLPFGRFISVFQAEAKILFHASASVGFAGKHIYIERSRMLDCEGATVEGHASKQPNPFELYSSLHLLPVVNL